MIDIMAVKLKVIQTSCGITALSELELLHRLEELYLEGIVEGMRIAKETITQPKGAVMNSPAQAAECAEARDRNTPNVHGSGAEPQGMEAQATQPSAAPNVVCSGCGSPTTLSRPLCAKCTAVMLSADSVCPHCNSALYTNANVQPANKWGIHLTKNGGYVGKCSAASIS